MKTTIAIALIALIVSNSSDAQTPQSKWLDYQNDANGEGLIFKTDYGYITFCGYVTLENYNYGVMVTGLSLNHEIIFEKPLISDTTNYGMYLAQSVIAANDSGYYQILFNSSDVADGFPMLVRYDSDGDTVWTKRYFENDPWEYRDFVLTQTLDGTLHLAGTHNPQPFEDEGTWQQVILKLDSQGNYQSHDEYTGYQSLWNYSILATIDGLVTAGRMCLNVNDVTQHKFRDFIRKFDLEGNSQWLTKIHAPPAGAEAGVYTLLQLENGNYLYGTGRSEGTLSGNGETSNVYVAPTIGEIISATGDSLYENQFNIHARYQQIFNLKPTIEGGFIAVGTHRFVSEGETSGWPIGFMLKLDANLNEQWYRYYVPSVWEGMGRWNNLTDVVENDNGTYTAVGLIYTNTGDGPQNGFIQDTYVLTVDSLGCLVEGCDVGISEFEYSDDLSVYPNPVSESVTIQFPSRHNWTIRIFNAQGLFVFEEKKIQSLHTTVSVESLPSGIYFLHCINQQGEIFVEQLIKN